MRDAESHRAREESHGDEGLRDSSWRETSCLAETREDKARDTLKLGHCKNGTYDEGKGNPK